MEAIVYKNNLYKLTKFIRTLPNAYKIIQEFSYQLGTEHEEMLHDLFDELYQKRLTNSNINNFLDICAAPGIYSKYILDKYPKSKGVGISLDPKEGGHEFKISNDDRYKKIYEDVHQIILPPCKSNNVNPNILELMRSPIYDLCITSCIPYSISAKSKDEYKIIFKSLTICLNLLKENGMLIINFTFKNMMFAINFVYLLSLLFRRIKLFKSTKLWILQRTFYVIGYEYIKKDEHVTKINNYLHDFDNFYKEYENKLLPEINKKSLQFIMLLFELDVFMPQIQTYMLKSDKI